MFKRWEAFHVSIARSAGYDNSYTRTSHLVHRFLTLCWCHIYRFKLQTGRLYKTDKNVHCLLATFHCLDNACEEDSDRRLQVRYNTHTYENITGKLPFCDVVHASAVLSEFRHSLFKSLACSFCALHTYSSRSTRNKPLPLSSVNVQSTMHKHFAIKSVITTSGESINFGAQERSKWRGPFVLAWGPSLNSVQSVYITHDKKCREAIIFKYSNTTCRHTKQFCLWGEIAFWPPAKRRGV